VRGVRTASGGCGRHVGGADGIWGVLGVRTASGGYRRTACGGCGGCGECKVFSKFLAVLRTDQTQYPLPLCEFDQTLGLLQKFYERPA